MPPAASKILQACRQASRAARLAASAASRCAAVVVRSGLGGAAASDPFLRSPYRSRKFGRGGFPIAATPPPRSPGSGSTIAAPPTNIHGPAPGKVKFVVEDKDLESNEALWALYERWCKAFNQERDYNEMACRFNYFKRVVLLNETNKAGINELSDGKLLELRSPKKFYNKKIVRRIPNPDLERPGDIMFKKDLAGHQLNNPNQSP